MACPISADDISKLQIFIQVASGNPSILNLPQLAFFKKFVEQLGGRVPMTQTQANAQADAKSGASAGPAQPEEPEEESDVELDNEGVVEPDTDPSQEMGETNKEPSEEEMDQANDIRGKAQSAFSDGDFEGAVNFYTEAILLNPTSSLFYAKRGQAFLKLVKPNACIRDCDRALELNCDSAAAYKFRGRANRLLGNWEFAAKDLRQACKLDYDEQADEWLKEVTPNAKKLEQHKIKQERKSSQKKLNDRLEQARQAKEAHKRAAEENANQKDAGGDGMDDLLGSMGPDIMDAFKDPEIAAALQDVMTNPGNIMKYQNNPKVMNLLKKFAGGAGGGGFPGMGGMGMGGMGGMPGMGGFGSAFGNASAPEESEPKPKKDYQDDGLD